MIAMVKILFVCHGNICRSPMGKYVLQDMVNKAGLSHRFEIDSEAALVAALRAGKGTVIPNPQYGK